MSPFLKGLAVGFSIAAPVGPIGLLCIRRSISIGRLAGFVSGLGAATADAFYGVVAALGLTALTTALLDHRHWLQLVGASFSSTSVSPRCAPARPPTPCVRPTPAGCLPPPLRSSRLH